MNDHNAMDALCRRMLSAASGHHSRRAFLSRVSRGLFGLVGVAIAASAPLFTAATSGRAADYMATYAPATATPTPMATAAR